MERMVSTEHRGQSAFKATSVQQVQIASFPDHKEVRVVLAFKVARAIRATVASKASKATVVSKGRLLLALKAKKVPKEIRVIRAMSDSKETVDFRGIRAVRAQSDFRAVRGIRAIVDSKETVDSKAGRATKGCLVIPELREPEYKVHKDLLEFRVRKEILD